MPGRPQAALTWNCHLHTESVRVPGPTSLIFRNAAMRAFLGSAERRHSGGATSPVSVSSGAPGCVFFNGLNAIGYAKQTSIRSGDHCSSLEGCWERVQFLCQRGVCPRGSGEPRSRFLSPRV